MNDECRSHQQTAPHDFVKAYDVIQVALKEFVHGFRATNRVDWVCSQSFQPQGDLKVPCF